jgi:hypothetical protein
MFFRSSKSEKLNYSSKFAIRGRGFTLKSWKKLQNNLFGISVENKYNTNTVDNFFHYLSKNLFTKLN